MGFVLISSCPPSSLVLASQLHQFSARIKSTEIWFVLNWLRFVEVEPLLQNHAVSISLKNQFSRRLSSNKEIEPIAFMGGMFAGLLRLDLNEEPLKEWVTRTVEASGITEEEVADADGMASNEEESPQQIEIE
ncbi:hypothetical protein HID58_066095 [Brassica napus]|uniref:Uncharacterized protein n=1 Tax=Brassica napus TaxID=3708 RepID=A0ABQ7ZEQ3_BRANA|nr:hypothetical protein HID58_066095 [Brassica napus]